MPDVADPPVHSQCHLGTGGCVAVALYKLRIITPLEHAKEMLNAQIKPFVNKIRADQRVPKFAGIPGDYWHKEVVKMTVVEAGYDFEKLDLNTVNLDDEIKNGRFLIDGVLNNSFVKRVKGKAVRFDTDPDDKSNPRENESGWRHAIAVQDGRVLEKEFEMSSQWLWLKGSTPDPNMGYMLKVLVVYRITSKRD